MSVTVEITSNRLPEILAGLDGKVAAAVTETALAVGIRAEALVPVDTGALKASIRVEPGKTPQEAFVLAGGGAVNYARFIEYGTRRAAAQPFMIPAAEFERPLFLERLKRGITP